jgi:hypothetical protein
LRMAEEGGTLRFIPRGRGGPLPCLFRTHGIPEASSGACLLVLGNEKDAVRSAAHGASNDGDCLALVVSRMRLPPPLATLVRHLTCQLPLPRRPCALDSLYLGRLVIDAVGAQSRRHVGDARRRVPVTWRNIAAKLKRMAQCHTCQDATLPGIADQDRPL